MINIYDINNESNGTSFIYIEQKNVCMWLATFNRPVVSFFPSEIWSIWFDSLYLPLHYTLKVSLNRILMCMCYMRKWFVCSSRTHTNTHTYASCDVNSDTHFYIYNLRDNSIDIWRVWQLTISIQHFFTITY